MRIAQHAVDVSGPQAAPGSRTHVMPRREWWLRVVSTGVLVAAAAVFIVIALAELNSRTSDKLGFDFRVIYLPAAEAVWAGGSPYGILNDRDLLMLSYLYPPQLALVLSPLATLPADVAATLAFLACLASVFGALALIGVRDLRCYAVMLLWAPTFSAFDTLNVSAAFVFGLALTWRLRSTIWPLGAVLGLMVPIKLFLWPIVVWVGLTRSRLAALLAMVTGLLITLGSWAVIGFSGIGSYPDLVTHVPAQRSYSIGSVATEHLGEPVGRVLVVLLGAALLAWSVRRARQGDEARSFLLAIAATLALSPVLWMHYIVLLVVPLGLLRPRFSAIWLVPLLPWLSLRAEFDGGDEHVFTVLVSAAMVAALLAHPHVPRRRLLGVAAGGPERTGAC